MTRIYFKPPRVSQVKVARSFFQNILSDKLKMSNFQDNPSVGNPNNKFDGENETPLKWAYEMDKTQFKYRCPCKKGYHAHGNGGDPDTNRVEHRSSHCAMYGGDVRIAITEETPRVW